MKRTLSEFREGLSAGTEDLAQFCRAPIKYLKDRGYSTKGLPADTKSLDPSMVKAAASAKDLEALLREHEILGEEACESEMLAESPWPKEFKPASRASNETRVSTEKEESIASSQNRQRNFSASESFPAVILERTGHEPVESFRGMAMESAAIMSGRGLPLQEFREAFQKRHTDCWRRRQQESVELASGGPPTPAMERLPDASLSQDAISRYMILGEPGSESIVAESIILQDDRVQVTDTTTHPFRWLCRLEITAATGARWLGTGWFAAPGLIVTAGHCVYIHNHGGWVSSVAAYVGQNGSQVHRSLASTRFASSSGWVQNRDTRYDYGVIFVTPGGDGYFGYGVLSDELLGGAVANVSGYPQDKPPGTMWGHAKQLLPPDPLTLHYQIDTFGGMSGAPVFLWDGRDYVVAGIHNYGDVAGNVATRVTPEIFKNLERWKTF